jgi:hypothetical protein
MARVIKVDFSQRGKDLYHMRKQRLAEKEFLKKEEKIQRTIERNQDRVVYHHL